MSHPGEPASARADLDAWPPVLPFEEWKDTYATVHRWLQIVGKTCLALAPPANHWWHATLQVTARGLRTPTLFDRGRTLDIELDFIDHALTMRTGDRAARRIPLAPRSVADFYREYRDALSGLGVEARMWPMPVEIEAPTAFAADREHASYDGAAVQSCWRMLACADRVMREFRGRFLGKASPVHFFWGSFDLACTRFSGRIAPTHPGIPGVADRVTREAYSHECISAGFWPGGPTLEPIFYSYAYPELSGYRESGVRPREALYHPDFREFVLPYRAVCAAPAPDTVLLEFLQSTYERGADLAGWDREALERR